MIAMPHSRSIHRSPRIVAVTVTYNSGPVLDDFLRSVSHQAGNWRLIIVDNLSSDGTRDRLAAIDDPRIEIILHDRNSGFSAGTNIGIQRALDLGAERIVLINNDTSFDADIWAYLDERLTATGADAISPVISTDPGHDGQPARIWYAGGTLTWSPGIQNHHTLYGAPLEEAPDAEFETEFCPACCMMFDRRVFEKIGLLSENYFVYVEDTDFSWRMAQAGMRILVTPNRNILHKESVLTGGDQSTFTAEEKAKGRVIFMRRFGSRAGLVQMMTLIAGGALVAAVKRPASAKLGRAKWRGLRRGLLKPLVKDPHWTRSSVNLAEHGG